MCVDGEASCAFAPDRDVIEGPLVHDDRDRGRSLSDRFGPWPLPCEMSSSFRAWKRHCATQIRGLSVPADGIPTENLEFAASGPSSPCGKSLLRCSPIAEISMTLLRQKSRNQRPDTPNVIKFHAAEIGDHGAFRVAVHTLQQLPKTWVDSVSRNLSASKQRHVAAGLPGLYGRRSLRRIHRRFARI